MDDTLAEIQHELGLLSSEDRAQVRDYVAYLRWRATRGERDVPQPAELLWQFNFLEHFATADVRASHGPTGMEVKMGEATVGGELRPALWEHPPVRGEAMVEFHVAVPAGLRDLKLRVALGIRDGVQPKDERLVAFRVRVDGWQVWSRAGWPRSWEPVEIPLPMQAGDVLRLILATDGLGDHRWAWAVWGDPVLVGIEAGPRGAGRSATEG
jgi:hypothetical protein